MDINALKQALQIHINMGECKDCAYAKLPIGNCERQMLKDALKLIEQNEKTEIKRLEYTLLGVMHSVDKWLDGDELEQDEVNRAITMREKTLQIVEMKQAEIERLNKVNASVAEQFFQLSITEFAERLKAKHRRITDYDEAGFGCQIIIVEEEYIDQVAKELKGEQ